MSVMIPVDDPLAEEVLRFWFGERAERGTSRRQWFGKNAAFDDEIRARFLPLIEQAAAGRLARWKESARQCLALVVLLDQFPRNVFRGTARAFAADSLAREVARHALAQGYDRDLPAVEKTFFYLPFEHGESLADQELSCELMKPLGEEALHWALKHKEIIERFGRFPHRNAILGRENTPEEIEFLKQPGSGF